MFYFFDNWFGVLLIALFAVLIILSAIGIPTYFVLGYTCTNIAEKMETDSQYGVFTGCMIFVDGKWVPLKQYRVLD